LPRRPFASGNRGATLQHILDGVCHHAPLG
jgi:hypothetical protein